MKKISEFLSENFQFLVVISQYILRGKNKYTGNYFFYFLLEFYMYTLFVDIIVKNDHLCISFNNFHQEILSKSKEMSFTETNKESK